MQSNLFIQNKIKSTFVNQSSYRISIRFVSLSVFFMMLLN